MKTVLENKFWILFNILILLSINTIDKPFFNIYALSASIFVWLVSCIFDKVTYLNIGVLISIVPFMYSIWWFLLNLPL